MVACAPLPVKPAGVGTLAHRVWRFWPGARSGCSFQEPRSMTRHQLAPGGKEAQATIADMHGECACEGLLLIRRSLGENAIAMGLGPNTGPRRGLTTFGAVWLPNLSKGRPDLKPGSGAVSMVPRPPHGSNTLRADARAWWEACTPTPGCPVSKSHRRPTQHGTSYLCCGKRYVCRDD